MAIFDEKLKDVLLKSGVITENDFNEAKEESDRSGQTIANVLIGLGKITEEYMLELLEGYYNLPGIDLKQVTIPEDVLNLIPEATAKAKKMVLFGYDADRKVYKIAMSDPLDYETLEYLRANLGAWVEPYFTSSVSLKYGLNQYKQKVGSEFNQLINENVQKFASASGEADLAKLAEAVPIVTILDSIIEHGVDLNASDIHFEPLQNEVVIRYRIDGIMHEISTLSKEIEPILVARVKVLASLRIDEHRVPQDGRFRFEVGDKGMIDLRVNIMPVMNGEKVEMRLLKSLTRPLSFEELGISPEAAKIIDAEIQKPHGMFLVTGPTGHGKTTTLYAILHMLNKPEVNIVTVEDPIEYEIPRDNQTQVNVKAGITFANGLRSLMRQNPDIIMIGEIRDNETVEIAVQSALTGHLVLSSLHTNDAASAIPRLTDMGAQSFLLASTLNIVLAQRLVRRICTSCIESYKTTKDIADLVKTQLELSGDIDKESVPKMMYRGKGCKVCGNSGFQGQVGIFELLQITEEIRELIVKQAGLNDIKTAAIKNGMVTMFRDGLTKVEKGITTIEEIVRVVRE